MTVRVIFWNAHRLLQWQRDGTNVRRMVSEAIADAEIIAVAEKLPSAPRLLVELGELMASRRCDVDDVVALLKQDPPLVAQILRMANSAAYSPVEKISHLNQALSFIGFSEIHRLVGVVASNQLADQQMQLYPIEGAKLRLNTLFVAVLMEELAKYAHEGPSRCYTVGLLRTMGMMALERLTPEQASITPFRESPETALHIWEQENWGITNVEVAEKILLHWNFPRETVMAIRHHCEPGRRHNPIIHLLSLAATAAAERFSGIPGEEGYWNPTPDTLAKGGLDSNRFRMACERAHRKFEKLRIAVN